MHNRATSRISRAWLLVAWAAEIAAVAAASDKPRIIWHDDFDTAVAEARLLDRPLLIYFTAKWCPACLRVEHTTFLDKRVIELVSQKMVAVRVDADAAPELAAKWNVSRLPAALVLSSTATPLGRIDGFVAADRYLAEVRKHVTANSSRPTTRESPESPSDPTLAGALNAPRESTAPGPPGSKTIDLAAHEESKSPRFCGVLLSVEFEPRLALSGACPVSMCDSQRIVVGNPDFAAEINGFIYWFHGPDELDKFRHDPLRYTPAMDGHCVVAFADHACFVPGSIHFAAVYRDRLYLFPGPDQRDRFAAHPEQYSNFEVR